MDVGPELDLVPGLDHLRALDRVTVEPRAVGRPEVGQHPGAAARADLRVLARHVRVVDHDVALPAAAHREPAGRPPAACRPAAAARSRRGSAHAPRAARRAVRRCCRSSSAPTSPRAAARLGLLLGAHDAGLDPELAEPEPIVGLELDHRARRGASAVRGARARAGSRPARRTAPTRSPRTAPIARREEHPILVRHVGPRQREGLVLLHLPGELAGDLDRAHLGPEGTAERAFNKASDLFLEAA